jgi:hypothetical protein
VVGVRNPKMKELDRQKLNTVLIIDVHMRDITDEFVRDRCRVEILVFSH